MNEEIEDHRYFLEPDGARITSVCVLHHSPGALDRPSGEFSVVIGIIEEARSALAKANELEDLLKPAMAHRNGAMLKNGEAVITLSYVCASPFGSDLAGKVPAPAYILGVLASASYISMADYERIMGHYMEMESLPAGLPPERTSLHALAGLH
jgi:hypothetical protein